MDWVASNPKLSLGGYWFAFWKSQLCNSQFKWLQHTNHSSVLAMSHDHPPSQEQNFCFPLHSNWFRDLPSADQQQLFQDILLKLLRKRNWYYSLHELLRYRHQASGGHDWEGNCLGNKKNMEERRVERCRWRPSPDDNIWAAIIVSVWNDTIYFSVTKAYTLSFLFKPVWFVSYTIKL